MTFDMDTRQTWTHMIHAACPEFLAELVGRGQPKVGDGNPQTLIEAKDVLGLEVSVVYA